MATLIGQSSRQESFFCIEFPQIWTSDQLIFDFVGPSDSIWGSLLVQFVEGEVKMPGVFLPHGSVKQGVCFFQE